MQRTTQLLMMSALLSAGVAAGVAIGRHVEPGNAVAATRPELPAGLKDLQEAFNRVAEKATQSVVHITTRVDKRVVDPRLQPSSNVGSGVITSEDGLIITNHHVIEGAKTLWVRLYDGSELPATVVGDDADSDLALLKVDTGGRPLPALKFADSEKARVGDWVLAIGSPFGYNHSVTSGIVSAKHRVAEWGKPYQDFIQTDAPINPGNSGGALVDLRGELLGINAAIVSKGGGGEGIGLSISSTLVQYVVERLKKDGRVRRGYMGIKPIEINQTLVDALAADGIRSVQDLLDETGLDRPRGVWITFVEPDSPAARAKLHANDVMVEFNGKKVAGLTELFFVVADAAPGQKVKVKVLRARKEIEIEVELAERPKK
jgi:serine protease Do